MIKLKQKNNMNTSIVDGNYVKTSYFTVNGCMAVTIGWDGNAIINALNPYLKDSDLAELYDKMVADGIIR